MLQDEDEQEYIPTTMSQTARELDAMSMEARQYVKDFRYSKAMPLYIEVTERYTNLFGPDHPLTLSNMHNLAFTLGKSGLHKRSLDTYEHVLERRTQILGVHHSETLNTMHNKAWLLVQMGDIASAKILYQQVLQLRMDTLGPLHVATRNTKEHLSALAVRQEICAIV